jgi:hypothetical protein
MSSTPESTADVNSGSLQAAEAAFESLLAGEQPETQEASESTQAPDYSDAGYDAPEDVSEPLRDDDESEAEQDPVPVYTIKVNGQEIEVPLNELINGYSRTADYTRKTQELAEARKAALAEFDQVRTERAQYAHLLNALQQQVEANTPAEPDWDRLRADDPIEYSVQWAEKQRQQQRLYAIQQEQGRLAEIAQFEQAQHNQSVLMQERDALLTVVPEWKNPETAKQERDALLAYGQQNGFHADELKSLVDHRSVAILRKAMLFDQLQNRAGQVKPVQRQAAPVLRPGAANTVPKSVSDLTRAKQRLAKTGSVRDAASAFEALLSR